MDENSKDCNEENMDVQGEQETQQLPPTDDGAVEKTDGGAKSLNILGREVPKKKAAAVGLGGLLVLALAGGGTWYAMNQKPQEAEPAPVVQEDKKEEPAIQIDVETEQKAKQNPDAEKAGEESKKADEAKPTDGEGKGSEPQKGAGTATATGGSTSNGSSSNQSQGGSTGNGGNSSGTVSKPQHTHNWVAQTTTVHHDAQYQTVHHDAIYENHAVCNGCGKFFLLKQRQVPICRILF